MHKGNLEVAFMNSTSDRIEKKILLRAVGDAGEFGSWFGVAFENNFVAGAPINGTIVPTKVDAQVAKAQEPYAGWRSRSTSTESNR